MERVERQRADKCRMAHERCTPTCPLCKTDAAREAAEAIDRASAECADEEAARIVRRGLDVDRLYAALAQRTAEVQAEALRPQERQGTADEGVYTGATTTRRRTRRMPPRSATARRRST